MSQLGTIVSNIAGMLVNLGGSAVTARALSSMPDSLRAATLPLRLVLADGTDNGGGIQALTLAPGAQQATWRIRDILVYRPVAQGVGLEDALPVLVEYAEDYAAALSENRNIADRAVIENVTAEFAVWEYPEGSGTRYHIVEHVLSVRETF